MIPKGGLLLVEMSDSYPFTIHPLPPVSSIVTSC